MRKNENALPESGISKKALIVFLVLVILLSGIVEAVYCSDGPDWLVGLLMWLPAISAFVASIIALIDAKEKYNPIKHARLIGIKFCNPLYVLLGLVIPFVYLFIPYRIYWTMHPENYAYSCVALSVVLKDLCVYTVVCVIISLLTAIGEEIGWRGFMLPALRQRIGVMGALAVVSIFWCLWHFPLLIFGGYMEGTPLWYQLTAFVLCIFPVGIIAGVLTLKSKSVWPAAFLHAAHNAFDQMVFDVITRGDDRMFFVSETGVFTIACAWIIAVIMLILFVKIKSRKGSEE
ncbi:MAG: CPBP family intramembrane metalloprotease [Lachnospiraceae bacterium]|nr:CPBP family intramembrane metalloprotease [Lachnospiraceae bacterium]